MATEITTYSYPSVRFGFNKIYAGMKKEDGLKMKKNLFFNPEKYEKKFDETDLDKNGELSAKEVLEIEGLENFCLGSILTGFSLGALTTALTVTGRTKKFAKGLSIGTALLGMIMGTLVLNDWFSCHRTSTLLDTLGILEPKSQK